MNIDFNPEGDGFNHINVYSKSRSKLGRMLSNFAHTPFTLKDNKFESVESWWYWSKMNNINKSVLFPEFSQGQLDEIRTLIGKEAKEYFRSIHKGDTTEFSPDKSELKEAYLQKLLEHPEIEKMLFDNKLPIAHYYMMFNKKVSADSTLWTAKLWEEIKNENS